jgi:hypothetical protein
VARDDRVAYPGGEGGIVEVAGIFAKPGGIPAGAGVFYLSHHWGGVGDGLTIGGIFILVVCLNSDVNLCSLGMIAQGIVLQFFPHLLKRSW